jgi:hypothetical protein
MADGLFATNFRRRANDIARSKAAVRELHNHGPGLSSLLTCVSMDSASIDSVTGLRG